MAGKVEGVSYTNKAYEGDENNATYRKTGDDVNIDVKVISEQKGDKPWNPYKTAGYELAWSCCMPGPYYKIRWMILGFFHRRIFSIWDHCITVGEALIIFVTLAGAITASILSCCDAGPTGARASLPLLATFILSSKNSLVTFVAGVPYERILLYHKFVAFISVLIGGYHGYVSYFETDEYRHETTVLVSGTVLLGAMVLSVLFSFYYLRKFFYELFYRIHIVLGVAIIASAVVHGVGILVVGAAFWAVDVLIKVVTMAWNYKWTKNCKVQGLPGNVVRIEFRKNNFRYRTGQHVMLCVPRISPFEWHPFSISSAPQEDTVTVHIKILGNWSEKLYNYLADGVEREMTVFVDGPFGVPGLDLDDEDGKLILLVSGGIGITPMQCIANELTWQMQNGREFHKIMFVWSFADANLLTSALDYQKDYMNKNESSEVFETHFHMSNRGDSEKNTEILAKSDANIKAKVQPGRPLLSNYFEMMFDQARKLDARNVSVLCCGPQPMMEETLKLSSKWSKDGVTFHYHGETFEL